MYKHPESQYAFSLTMHAHSRTHSGIPADCSEQLFGMISFLATCPLLTVLSEAQTAPCVLWNFTNINSSRASSCFNMCESVCVTQKAACVPRT